MTRANGYANLNLIMSIQSKAVDVLEDNKAQNIVTIDLANKASFADSMIVACGTSSRHVAMLTKNLSNALKQEGAQGVKTQGEDKGDWALVDCGDIVVHIMREEIREFYDIESLWA